MADLLWFGVVLALIVSGSASVSLVERQQVGRERPTGKVVFLRGATVATALADGTNVREVAHDAAIEAVPKWSPDGRRIVYKTKGGATGLARTVANLVVIDEQGRRVNRLPIYGVTPDGMEIAGMIAVWAIGWHGPNAVFATGNINPHINDYRAYAVDDGSQQAWTNGLEFAPCGSVPALAYVEDPRRDPAHTFSVAVDGATVFRATTGGVTRIESLTWTGDCRRLGFVVRGSKTEVVVLDPTAEWRQVARQPMASGRSDGELVAHENDLVFVDGAAANRYDPRGHTFKTAPSLSRELQNDAAQRGEVLGRLGTASADWWFPK